MKRGFLLLFILCLSGLVQTLSAAPSEAEMERWLEDDGEERALETNEGELVFLPNYQKRGHFLQHHITLSRQSLKDGWAQLTQCHRNLDQISRVQIVYRYIKMRNMQLLEHQNIGQIWLQEQSVQMRDVGAEAYFCLKAEVKVLQNPAAGEYGFSAGPFYRRFLDGYYPFHIQFRMDYPVELLNLVETSPSAQLGFQPRQQAGRYEVDCWFEGQLRIGLRFKAHSPPQ